MYDVAQIHVITILKITRDCGVPWKIGKTIVGGLSPSVAPFPSASSTREATDNRRKEAIGRTQDVFRTREASCRLVPSLSLDQGRHDERMKIECSLPAC